AVCFQVMPLAEEGTSENGYVAGSAANAKRRSVGIARLLARSWRKPLRVPKFPGKRDILLRLRSRRVRLLFLHRRRGPALHSLQRLRSLALQSRLAVRVLSAPHAGVGKRQLIVSGRAVGLHLLVGLERGHGFGISLGR